MLTPARCMTEGFIILLLSLMKRELTFPHNYQHMSIKRRGIQSVLESECSFSFGLCINLHITVFTFVTDV